MCSYGAGKAVITLKQDVLSSHAMDLWGWRRLTPPAAAWPTSLGGDGVAALRASNAMSGMTGDTIFIDAGPHNMG